MHSVVYDLMGLIKDGRVVEKFLLKETPNRLGVVVEGRVIELGCFEKLKYV